jgi:mRNA interferase MazF
VIQNDTVNETTIRSVLMCTLTSNLRRAGAWGNVLLQRGEAGLPEQSVVLVSQIVTVDKTRLRERVGRLSAARIRQILDGIRLITEPGPD